MLSIAVRTIPDSNAVMFQISDRTSIATSNAQNDSGMFELNFRDEH